jgi:hypothetical protein
VPYCTGDVHAGNNPNASVSGVIGTQQFVGYTNTQFFLKKIGATFPDMAQLVVTGASAGGFGAAANYGQALDLFPSIPVYLVDDSGPPMRQPPLAQCLQTEFKTVWGLDKSIHAECGADCAGQTDWLMALAKHSIGRSKYATGLISATADAVISFFWGFGADNCTGLTSTSASDYAAGLQDVETQLAADKNFGAYLYGGTNHTVMEGDLFYSSVDGGQSIAQWVGGIVGANQVTNVGP